MSRLDPSRLEVIRNALGGMADTMAMPPAEARATACSMSAMMSSRPTKAPGRQAVVIEGERPQAGKVRG